MTTNLKKNFTCAHPYCNKQYKTKYSLKRHYLTHTRIKQHQCFYCEKRFSLQQYLEEHIYIHTGEMPFVCKYPGCGRKFRQAGKLSIHKKTHCTSHFHGNASQESTKLNEINSQGLIIQQILNQISKFQLPDYFHSRVLPLPLQLVGPRIK